MLRKINTPFILLATMVFVVSANAEKRMGESFDLRVGESVLITDTDVRVGFDLITHESRCPLNVTCVWEGNATALLWTQVPRSEKKFFDLNTNPRFKTQTLSENLVVQLQRVSPHPIDGIPIDPNAYVVALSVVRPEDATVPIKQKTWGAIKELYK